MAPVSGVEEFIDQMNKENKVMIWSKSYCPFCKQVQAIFQKLNQPFLVYELDLQENGAALHKGLVAKTGQKTVPNIFVNSKHLGGASNTEKALKDGRLQQLLVGDTTEYDYDLVNGSGSGGLVYAKEVVQFDKKDAVADFVKPTPIGSGLDDTQRVKGNFTTKKNFFWFKKNGKKSNNYLKN